MKRHESYALFLDYDGTLTPIVNRPEEANVSRETLRLLKSLAENRRLQTAVVSGRSVKDLKTFLGSIEGLILAGNHGLEIEGPGIKYLNQEAASAMPLLGTIRDGLKKAVGDIEGCMVEDKGFTLSMHYRNVDPSRHHKVHELFYQEVGEHISSGEVVVRAGKMVLEVRPKVDWDKGRAALYMLDLFPGDSHSTPCPVYIGDDATDEDAFRALRDKGLTIVVVQTPRRTTASYFVKDNREVVEFLKYLAEIVK